MSGLSLHLRAVMHTADLGPDPDNVLLRVLDVAGSGVRRLVLPVVGVADYGAGLRSVIAPRISPTR